MRLQYTFWPLDAPNLAHWAILKMSTVSSINKQHMDSRWRAHVNIDEYKSIRHFGGQRKSELNSEIKMNFFPGNKPGPHMMGPDWQAK